MRSGDISATTVKGCPIPHHYQGKTHHLSVGVDSKASPNKRVTWEVITSSSSTSHTPDLSQSSMAVLSDHPESSGPGKPIQRPFLSDDCSNNLLAGSNGLITSHIMMRAVSELPSWLPDPCLDTKEQRDSWSPTHKLFDNRALWVSV